MKFENILLELVFPLLLSFICIVITRGMTSFNTLRCLSFRHRDKLLLQFSGNTHCLHLAIVRSVSNFRIDAHENACVWGTWGMRRIPLSLGWSWIDRKSSVYISPSLVEFNGLPGVFGSVADAWTIDGWRRVASCCWSTDGLHLDVSFDLGFAKAEG